MNYSTSVFNLYLTGKPYSYLGKVPLFDSLTIASAIFLKQIMTSPLISVC